MRGYGHRYLIDKAQSELPKITMHKRSTFFQLTATWFILGGPKVSATILFITCT